MDAARYFFIVGTPRSGTTLLQSKMVNHLSLSSCEETHLFPRMHPRGALSREFYTGRRQLIRTYISIAARYNLAQTKEMPMLERYLDLFRRITDKEGSHGFLEKTPRHLIYVPQIKKHIPSAVFVHIVRDRYETVRSLWMAAKTYPQHWSGTRTIRACVERWESDLLCHQQYLGAASHYFVDYARFVQHPTEILSKLSGLISIPMRKRVVDLDSLISPAESWKKNVALPVGTTSSYNFMARADFERMFPDGRRSDLLMERIKKQCL
ncbi:sulfotransferase family protein [Frateuria hangzhouensis]|uniref:sulfotransferase family protein n=1 Tax=Frateuria hangzhouensis TaxID=2995589 RepID=UPI002260FC62|nr:sulfotransferase [Frateuria sp. STR12]MCX7515312.1 sulfotransferase [Frateuria sp. STR12]